MDSSSISKSNKFFTLVLLLIVASFLLLPSFTLAATGPLNTSPGGTRGPLRTSGSESISIPNPLQVSSFSELIAKINRWLLVIGAPILTLMIIIGAFQILTAAGNPEKIKTGKQTITYAIAGYALLLISTGITTLIKNVLSVK